MEPRNAAVDAFVADDRTEPHSWATDSIFISVERLVAGNSKLPVHSLVLLSPWVRISTGIGNTIVWFFSADTCTRLCRKRRCMAFGCLAIISAASASFWEA